MALIDLRNVTNKSGVTYNAGSLDTFYAEDYLALKNTLQLAGSSVYISGGSSIGSLSLADVNETKIIDGTTYAKTDVGIQAAINSLPSIGGEIYLPSGTYTFSGSLPITQNNLTIRGVGSTSIITAGSAMNENIIRINATGVTLRDFTVDGNKSQQTDGNGISTEWNAHNLKCINLYVHDTFKTGITWNNCDDVLVQSCHLVNCGDSSIDETTTGFGISATSSENFRILDNRINNSHSDNIFVSGTNPQVGQNFIINGNVCTDVNSDQRSNISVWEGQDGVVSDNVCADNADNTKGVNGIFVRRAATNIAANIVVSDNRVESVSGVGIEIQNAGCTVTGNRIVLSGTGTDANGMFLSGLAHDCVVSNNVVEDATQHGIALNGSMTNVIVTNNIVKNVRNSDADSSCVRCICDSGTQQDIIIANNQFVDEQGTPLTKYGIYCSGTGSFSNFNVHDNIFIGMVTAEMNGVVPGIKTEIGTYGTIQEAIDSLPAGGGEVYIPAGTYPISSSISISEDNIFIHGAGNSTKLVAANGLNATVVQFSNCDKSGINQVYIDGNKANQSGGDCLNFDNCTNFFAENIYAFEAFANGVTAYGGCQRGIFDKCTGDGQINDGILIHTSSDIEVSNCFGINSSGAAGNGFGFYYGTGFNKRIVVSNCIAYNNGGHGFNVENGDKTSIIGCYSYENSNDGFLVMGDVTNVILSGCIGEDNDSSGFRVHQGGHISVVGCQFINNDARGVSIASIGAVTNLNITGCNISDNAVNGILTFAGVGSNWTISGNTIEGNGDWGIEFGAAMDYVIITNNNLRNNTNGAITGTLNENSIIANNITV